MTVQSVDHAALAPVYAVIAAAVLALLVDLVLSGPERGPGTGKRWAGPVLLGVGALGPVTAVVSALVVGSDRRGTFCTPSGVLPGDVRVGPSCSFVVDAASVSVTVLGCSLALVVLALSVPIVRSAVVPAGEYVFLLLCSLVGLVVLGSARDLLTLLIAIETLTLPVYVLVGLVRRGGSEPGDPASAEAAVTFFVTSVVATTLTLLGIALLYGVVGAVHLDRVAAALAARPDARELPLVGVAVLLVLAGLLFKLAAVPFHAWAPATYDGAPLPVAAWLATGSKLGGAVAVVVTVGVALRPVLDVLAPVLAVVAVVTMTVGNLVALRQRRLVRLLAWSAVAQTGYLLAPLATLTTARGDDLRNAIAGVAAFTALYLVVSVGTFAAVVALRGAGAGGTLDDLAGAARRAPWATAAFVLGMAGLAGLPPGLAGLFAKVVVVKAALDGSAGWLAVVIGLNAVIGLAFYARAGAACFAPPRPSEPAPPRPSEPALQASEPAGGAVTGAEIAARRASASWAVGAAVVLTATAGVVLGAWPQWVFDAAESVARALE
ncbi:NADH-quinone oxidoreductase subunit N [Cryptosporangium aurantiacum]|uniref:NADH-quinone oxidoreductase subunit N n=1 Tax=Cryptosporangium aurantiacum TaxID=134849 RepID=A0A1M7RMT8_9ACTN|nr:proton-conducting transporter membrane subunit [Cryptosporangium aurantiacum]SHN47408.1 NADH dehydrogenase subunit N [Cryptosporangium aurantiacum]